MIVRRRTISLFLVMSMLLACCLGPTAFAADTPSSWAEEEVSAAVDTGIVPENLQGDYQSPTTRAAVAELFVGLMEYCTGKDIEEILDEHNAVINPDAFTDTDDKNVLACNALGIINGVGNKRFDPRGEFTRAHIAAIINRVARTLGKDTEGFAHSFTDVEGHWVDSELGWPVENNIIKGVGGSRFDPDSPLTVEQAILITYRAVKPLSDGSGVLETDKSRLDIYFLDVGQADAAVLICDGRAMMIDGGNAADSSLVYSFLKQNNLNHLDAIVCTHAHEDHVGGLAGALNYAAVDTAYCSVADYDSKAFQNFVKYLAAQGRTITVPEAGDTFTLGTAEITVLGPINQTDDPNNMSLVLRIVFGNTSFLFAGDAEREEEQDILAAGYALKSDVLKVGHHGSETSTTYPFLREIMPKYGIISVGTGNSYGHPHENTLSRLRDADVTVYRTDMQGDIHLVSDGENITVSVEKNADADTLDGAGAGSSSGEAEESEVSEDTSEEDAETSYVLNTSTHKFHYAWCSSVSRMSDKNKQYYTGSRADLIAQGYEPCGICNP